MVYLDNSATTKPDPEVISVINEVMQHIYGNPSSLHGLGAKAERLLERARGHVAQVLGVNEGEIFFTSGGTEANNIAIKGVAWQYEGRGRHIITTEVEHASVYQVCEQLGDRGWQITVLPVDRLGRVSPEEIEAAITDKTVLVSIMHVNNEVGTIQPIAEIGKRLAKYKKVLFHVDAVQSLGRVSLFPREWGVDLLSLSGHKFHGPKGVGCLYIKQGITLSPLIAGGGQEGGLRSGTQNVPGIAGLAKAVLLAKQRQPELIARLSQWKAWLIEQVTRSLKGVVVGGDISPTGGAPHIISLAFPGLKAEVVVHALEQEGIYISSKSACSSKREQPSRILSAMGYDEQTALGAIRISMGWETTEEDVRKCAQALIKVVPNLQQIMKVRG